MAETSNGPQTELNCLQRAAAVLRLNLIVKAMLATVVVLLVVLVVVVMLVDIAPAESTHFNKPNIIFVVADDLGWNDVGWHNPAILTPNLNRYAHEGVLLNNSYAQYYCSPSRNCYMTGYFPYHTGLQHQVIYDGQPLYVPLKFSMLPELLKPAGYATHIVGKWHLGMCNWNYTPTYRGFDSFFGYYNGDGDYYTHKSLNGYDMRNNTEVALDPSTTYFNYLFTEHTINLIENHDISAPLFLYLPFHLVHNPLQVPLRFETPYLHTKDQNRRILCGMVSMMDEAFGNITEALDRKGLLNNALLIFTSDNGGSVLHGANNWPLRGSKSTFWEGGTKVTGFVWSRNLLRKAGYVNEGMFHAVDWFPTILHLAGAKPEKGIDGVNQWDMLSTGAPSHRDEFVYNIDGNRTGIRYKDFKLLTGSPGDLNDWYPEPTSTSQDDRHTDDHHVTSQKTGQGHKKEWKPQLYNIRDDPEERHDLASTNPQTLRMMLKRLDTWMASRVPAQRASISPESDPSLWGGVWTPGWC